MEVRAVSVDISVSTERLTRSIAYYQKLYHSIASELPEEQALTDMMKKAFRDTPFDLAAKIDVLRAMMPRGRVLDFGCSWGYGAWQLRSAGYDVVGFEVSKPRAEFGRRKLNLDILDEYNDLRSLPPGTFDAVFTNHVLEHLPNIGEVFALFGRLTRRGGVAFHVLPNFSSRAAQSGAFWQWIGRDHPIALTVDFFRRNLSSHGFNRIVIGSGPFTPKLVGSFKKGWGTALILKETSCW